MGYISSYYYEINSKTKINLNYLKKTDFKNWYLPRKQFQNGFYNVNLLVKNGELLQIEPEEYNSKFYDDKEFTEWLSKVLLTGKVRIWFIGEDNEIWGYDVYPNKIVELECKLVPKTK